MKIKLESIRKVPGRWLPVAAIMVACGIAVAQDDNSGTVTGTTAPATTPADSATPPAGDAASGPTDTAVSPAASSTPAAPAVPVPALLTNNDGRGMLLSVTKAGGQIVAVGGNGVILRSAKGESWQQVASPIDTELNSVAFADDSHGWAVGHDGVILGTSDGGSSWKIQNFEPDRYAPLFAVLPVTADTVITVGAFGSIKVTADGGAHWANVDSPELSQEKFHLNAITRLANGKLAVAGEHGMIGVSADGLHWLRANTPYEGSFFGILPRGAGGAIAFGMRGNVYVTDELGDHAVWRKLPVPVDVSFFGGEALADGSVVLTGAEGNVVVIGADGQASRFKNAVAGATQGTLTGSLTTPDSVIVVGESGVKRLPKT